MSRNFTPYELNFLKRAKIDLDSIGEDDETPVEYLAGYVEFLNHKFIVNTDVLIPRIETETLVKLALNEAVKIHEQNISPITIADVGTGSGAIAISLALFLLEREIPFKIIGSEISTIALEIAKKNRASLVSEQELSKNDSRLVFIESDLLSAYPDTKFDLMVANLPYIPTDRIEYLDASVKHFEPRVALDGGATGFELIDNFLSQAEHYLKDAGKIILEVDYTHSEKIFAPLENIWSINLIRDTFNKQRFAILKKLTKKE